uniref:Uncharacterized protein n=1 Tax=Pithovirus LCPAC401 TaxID=2506595 RepID=A0A481ZBD2_9VIRU|nr:MAG: uncharacterized protein LCPAC401_00980 [Pithovirus LCPAC401]
MNRKSLETVLRNHGYRVIDRINTSNLCEYIKCLSKSGHYVFVKPDEEGVVSKSNSDYIYRITEDELISYEMYAGLYNTIGSGVAGIGIESQDGVTFIITSDSRYPTVTNFINDQSINMLCPNNENLLAYPVVRLSEILSHSKYIEKMIKSSSKNIMRIQYTLARSRLITLKGTMVKVNEYVDTFIKLKSIKITELLKSIDELEDVADGNEKCSEKNEEKDRQVTDNLEMRHNLFTNLVHMCNRICTICKLNEVNDHMVEVTEHIKSKYNDLDKVF